MKSVRNGITLVCLLVLSVLTVGLFFGCGLSGTTSSTTSTLTAGASVGQVAQNVASIATTVAGISNVSSLTGNLGSYFSGIISSSVRAKAVPPSSFFTSLTNTGWLTVSSTGQTVQMRFYSKDGRLINDTFLTGKKIMTVEGYDLGSLGTIASSVEAGIAFLNLKSKVAPWLLGTTLSPVWDVAAANQANFYGSSNKYRGAFSLFDYILWAYISPSITGDFVKSLYEAGRQSGDPASFTVYPNIGTPEAVANDLIGSGEAQVNGNIVGGGTIAITMNVSFDASGIPVGIIGSGSSTLTDGTVITVTLNIILTDVGPAQSSSITIVASSQTIPANNMSLVLSPTYSAGVYTGLAGDVYNTTTTPATLIGGVVIFAAPDAQGHNGYFLSNATGSTKEYF